MINYLSLIVKFKIIKQNNLMSNLVSGNIKSYYTLRQKDLLDISDSSRAYGTFGVAFADLHSTVFAQTDMTTRLQDDLARVYHTDNTLDSVGYVGVVRFVPCRSRLPHIAASGLVRLLLLLDLAILSYHLVCQETHGCSTSRQQQARKKSRSFGLFFFGFCIPIAHCSFSERKEIFTSSIKIDS
uniref:Uncharacterized protein n=1 Tax=Graphocephala atropunctata TaxID=36148 RepID=A0A1B6M832_9HEMI